ncbi:MAG: hypothetical protein IT580_10665 [Verrucomicrobiales bacterium]|nr:hypothetical protein [Verrucomicrobiales bacterium]
MKILRSPLVVGLMALLAVGVMVGNLFWPAIQRWRVNRAAAAAAALVAQNAPLGGPPAAPAGSASGAGTNSASTGHVRADSTSMDRATIREQALRWLQAATRDPFLAIHVPGRVKPKGPPASDNLQVSAILRQTGSQLAVINQLIVGEGDKIAGYALERIEGDGVWVRGTNGLERVQIRGPISEPEPVVPPPAARSAEVAPAQKPTPS